MSADPAESMGAVTRRLLVAGLLSAAIAGVCWWLLPKAGMYVPWYVPVLAFIVITIAALARAAEVGDDDGDADDANDPGPPDVAGRIGNEFDDSF